MERRIDINGEDVLDNVKYAKLIRILILMEANSHLSASGAGLKERKQNRDEAIRLLQTIVNLSGKEIEEMYQLFLMKNT